MAPHDLRTHSCRSAFGGLAAVLLGVATFWALSLQLAFSADEPRFSSSFDPALVRKGAQLAALGNCAACHTGPHGKPFAGGKALTTPFGTIYGTNITPDPDTGIGEWSRADFLRAMHDGLDRRGRHLYPAFPFDHFTRVTDEDVDAIYAFLMTRDPVRAATPRNELTFPFNIRATVGVWKLLYFQRGPYQPNPSQNAQWNRGAYLAEGLAHCGACHTPRNFLGAEEKSLNFAGGESEDWHAPALNSTSSAPAPWTADRLYAYLRDGMDDIHDVAAGPMAPVVHNLSQVPEEDVRAIAIYVASLGGGQTTERRRNASGADQQAVERGATIYAGGCAICHDIGRQVPGGALQLSRSTSVALPDPGNLIRIVLDGIVPVEGETGSWMPEFAGALTERQVTDLLIYLRSHFGEQPAWPDVAGEVGKAVRNRSKR